MNQLDARAAIEGYLEIYSDPPKARFFDNQPSEMPALSVEDFVEFVSLSWGESRKAEVSSENARKRHHGMLSVQVVTKLGIGALVAERRAGILSALLSNKTIEVEIITSQASIRDSKQGVLNHRKFDGSSSQATGYYMVTVVCPFYVDDFA